MSKRQQINQDLETFFVLEKTSGKQRSVGTRLTIHLLSNSAIPMVIKSESNHDGDAEDIVDYKQIHVLPTDLAILL